MLIETRNQNSQSSTSNLTPNDQIETMHQRRQITHVNHQLNSHIKPTNHKHQTDINNLSESLEKLSISHEQSHNNSHENRQTEKHRY